MDPRPIPLEGRHVRLEPLTLAHAPALLAALAEDASIWQWMSIEPPLSLEAMETHIRSALDAQASGGQVAFVQVSLADGRACGATRYLNISRTDRGLEIGWTWIGKRWQRTAINTEAKFLLLRHAFEVLGAARVQLKTDARNLQSQAAIARIGGVREGVLRKYQKTRGDFLRDTVMFSIIDDEWPAVKERLVARLGG
ncbi:GNAT family N-acetyltransferase [Polyangium jinanense]|uniref:GNAT family N-acetyltransferase n=1 Tax=Polyangium jinanense TaxID=2829994 RepID=A0A9X3XAJ4_9BACT|nr:GNAT family protein [Polyangium jinanense]MDC3960591.1 GNAT family N-acetyltransferase [Polyangium jinanense]MDC3962689.1 GNAT family N-acetyltransferase [Polyangium jinanense]MDC3985453.1 GNAT family N-acetyltransferase [Polyangium jinanense]